MKTPDYVLCEDIDLLDDNWDKKVVPAGTFVKPVHENYVPAHVKDRKINMWFNSELDEYCYSSFGFLIVPKKLIRRV